MAQQLRLRRHDSARIRKITTHALGARQQSILPIATFAAAGDMAKLGIALNQGFDAGLTVSDARELLVQLYAYAGFPCSLNALTELMKVVAARKQHGIHDAPGREPSRAVPRGDALHAAGAANQTRLVGLMTTCQCSARSMRTQFPRYCLIIWCKRVRHKIKNRATDAALVICAACAGSYCLRWRSRYATQLERCVADLTEQSFTAVTEAAASHDQKNRLQIAAQITTREKFMCFFPSVSGLPEL